MGAVARGWQVRRQWNETEHQYVRFSCFSAVYIAMMLEHEHGLPSDARRLLVTRTLHGTTIDWTLGGLLYQLSLRPGARGSISADTPGATALLGLWALWIPASC